VREFVLDCSATLPWVFASEATPATRALQDQLARDGKAWVPALWHLEVGNALLVARRRNRIDQAGIAKFFSTLNLYDIEVDNATVPAAWSATLRLAEGHNLSLYAAAYLELALRKGVPLATLDARLRQAVKQAGGTVVL